jgi:purine nucleoside phosphorylase
MIGLIGGTGLAEALFGQKHGEEHEIETPLGRRRYARGLALVVQGALENTRTTLPRAATRARTCTTAGAGCSL